MRVGEDGRRASHSMPCTQESVQDSSMYKRANEFDLPPTVTDLTTRDSILTECTACAVDENVEE